MSRSFLLIAAVLAAATACGNPPPLSTRPPIRAVGGDGGLISVPLRVGEPAPPTLRLPPGFTPTGYRASLDVDPGQPTFTGTVELTGTLAAPASLIWLNGERLDITAARARIGDRTITLDAIALEHDFIGVRAPDLLPAGPVTLQLDYQGRFQTADTSGAFVQPDAGTPYVFTQFEPLGARSVFPCVDEPWSKVPWELTLIVPPDHIGLGNAAVASEAVDGDRKHIHFAATAPLPTYLLAFAVGPFELVDGGQTRGGAPIRIAAFRGRAAEAAWSAEVTGKVIAILEDWFGTPYPFDKLDSVPIPATVGFSAMENAGLITYREDLLLLDPEHATEDARREYVLSAGHEIAHQWFGNLVTPAWWDDLWLNEAFATWMEEKVMATFSPAWGLRTPVVVDRDTALGDDGLVSARMIRQPIEDSDDILGAFDGITYQKGAAVIRMFESWIGADAFRAGVRAYLTDHAGGSATSTDFLAAIDGASDLDVTSALRGYLDQAGAPRVAAALRCDKKQAPVVTLTQSRWLPRGVTAPAGASPRWQIPVCVAYGTVKLRAKACTVLTDETVELTLDGKCPQWLLTNADARGYYRMGMSAEQLAELLDDGWPQLRPHERILLAGDVRAEIERGGLPLGAELGLVKRLLKDGTRHAVELAVEIARDALAVASEPARPQVIAWIQDTFAPRARKLGFLADEDDDLDRELVRGALLPLVTEVGGDDKLRDRAVELARKWHELPEGARVIVLRAAVLQSDKVRASVLAALPAASDAAERADLIAALSALDDPEQAGAALALLLDPALDLKEGRDLLTGLAEHPSTQPVVEAFLRAHVAELLPRMPSEAAAGLITVLTASCDAGKRAEVAAWAKDHLAGLPGGVRTVAQALESMDQCIARKAALGPELDTWLTARD